MSLAALAGIAAVSGESARSSPSSGAELPVSAAAAGTARAGTAGPRPQRRRSPARGPARSRNSGRCAGLCVRPAGLLRAVRLVAAFSAAALLFGGVPTGVTAGARAGTVPAGAAAARHSPAAAASPRPSVKHSATSSRIARGCSTCVACTGPEEEGAGGRAGACPPFPSSRGG